MRRERRTKGFRRTLLAGVAAAAISASGSAVAQVSNWTGATSTDWFAGSNWDFLVPQGTVSGEIDTVSPNPTVLDGGTVATTGDLTVGDAATGNLTVRNGGQLTIGFGVVGSQLGSSGTVIVTGPGSSWTSSTTLFIGDQGTGSLTIADGADFSGVAVVLGQQTGGSGSVTVTGIGSTWVSSSNLSVGSAGTGSLTVSNGGSVSTTTAFIGASAGSLGSATVTGSGSTWSSSQSLFVGDRGTASLAVQNGGAVSASTAVIAGNLAGSSGSMTISGPDSTLSSTQVFLARFGTASLTVENGGTVSSSNSFIGEQVGSSGSATVRGAGSIWTSAAGLRVGDLGAGTLNVSDGGTVRVQSGTGLLLIATGGASIGTLTIGAASGQAARAPGVVEAGEVGFGFGAGTLVFNHTGTNYTFAPDVTGSGTIRQESGDTRLTGNLSAFTGSTIISGGTLSANGVLGGTTQVASGGRLGGTGTVGSTSVSSGGTVAPGNSIGTLNVAGDVTFDAGSRLEIETDPASTASDRLVATGAVTINGGEVLHIGESGTYAASRRYRIIEAGTGLTGAFAGVRSVFAFLTPSLIYDYGGFTVDLQLDRNQVAFAARAATRNQAAAANGVEALGIGNAVYDAVSGLPDDQATIGAALDSLSGEVQASAATMLTEDSRFVRDAVTDRLRAALDNTGTTIPVMAYAPGGPAAVVAPAERFAFWGQGFGSWGSSDGNRNAGSLDRSIGGFLIGGDLAVSDHIRVGAVGGYGRSSLDLDARASSAEADSYHAGLYAGAAFGVWRVRLGGLYAWHDLETRRIASVGTLSQRLTADRDGSTAQAFGEVGYRLRAGRLALEPFAGLAFVSTGLDGFTEAGGAAALNGRSETTETGFSTLGLRGAYPIRLGGLAGDLTGALGWRHAFGDVTPTASLAFGAGTPFTVAGAPIARDAALLEAGLSLDLTARAAIALAYRGQIADNARDHGITGRVEIRF